MYCTNCGSQIHGEFCTNCGMRVVGNIQTTTRNNEKHKNFSFKFMVFIAIFILMYGANRIRLYAEYQSILRYKETAFFVSPDIAIRGLQLEKLNLDIVDIIFSLIIPGLCILIGCAISNRKEKNSYLISGLLYLLAALSNIITLSRNIVLFIGCLIFGIANIIIHTENSNKNKELTTNQYLL